MPFYAMICDQKSYTVNIAYLYWNSVRMFEI